MQREKNGSELLRNGFGSAISPFFSVVVTTYNRPALLSCALRSIQETEFQALEVIVVNDAGADVSELLEGFSFPLAYVVLEKNSGPAFARNSALRYASGKYIVFLDDDDVFLPNHLDVLYEAIQRNPGFFVYSDAIHITENIDGDERFEFARELRYEHEDFSLERLHVENYIPLNTFACPLHLIVEVGGFDTELSGLEDWDLLLKLSAKVPFFHVQKATVEVRMRLPTDSGALRRSEQAFDNYPKLYAEIYSRYPFLESGDVADARSLLMSYLVEKGHNKIPDLEGWLKNQKLSPQQVSIMKPMIEAAPSARIAFFIQVDDFAKQRSALLDSISSIFACQFLSVEVFLIADEGFLLSDYPCVRWIISSQAEMSAVLLNSLRSLDSDWFAFLECGEKVLEEGIVLGLLQAGCQSDVSVFYGDKLYAEGDAPVALALKSGFNLDMLLSAPRLHGDWFFLLSDIPALDDVSAVTLAGLAFEIVLRYVEAEGMSSVLHVEELLTQGAAPILAYYGEDRDIIISHLARRGYAARVVNRSPGTYYVDYGCSERRSITILLKLDSDLESTVSLIEKIFETCSDYTVNIVLLACGYLAPVLDAWLTSLESLKAEGISILRFTGKPYGEVLNFAFGQSGDDFLLLLSSKIRILQGNWLEEMLNHGGRSEVAMVSPKFLSFSGSIAGAGLIPGLEGYVRSPFVGNDPNDAGYLKRLQLSQNFSALPSEALLISRSALIEVGGFKESLESELSACIDLGFRLTSIGYLNVWVPDVVMSVAETEVAKEAPSASDSEYFYSVWLSRLSADISYNSRLGLESGGFSINYAQPVGWHPRTILQQPRVLAYAADMHGCGHYRVLQPHLALREQGLIDGSISDRLLDVVELERFKADSVVFQRQITSEQFEIISRNSTYNKAFKVFELDDYLPNLPMKSLHRSEMPRDVLRSLRRVLSCVDRFVVSSDALAEGFDGLHSDIRVVKNYLPVNWWLQLQPLEILSDKPRVGWGGGVSHSGDLEMIADVVRDLAPYVDWVFFGFCPEIIKPYVREFHAGVPIERYPEKMASLGLSLAIAPLEDNFFNRCKTNLKLLEYGACGYPVLASDVGCYASSSLPVFKVKNRYRDWVDSIRSLIAEPDILKAAGCNLRRAVNDQWMLEGNNLQKWYRGWLQ